MKQTKTKTKSKKQFGVQLPVIRTFSEDTQIEDLMHLIKMYGIEYEKILMISLWEMAFNINNTWKAEHFVNKHKLKSVREYNNGWAIQDYDLGKLFEPIIKALLWTDKIELKRGGNDIDYLIAKSSL